MSFAGIKDTKTLDKVRKGLEEQNLIETVLESKTKPRLYRLCCIEPAEQEDSARGINPLTKGINPLTKGINPLDENTTRGINPLDKGNKSLRLGELTPYTRGIIPPISETEIYRDSLSRVVAEKDERSTTPTTEVNKEVLNFYQNNIRPICSSFELERLGQDAEMYGNDTVIKAIERAVLRGRRNLGYVEGILRRWQEDGYDEEGDRDADDSRSTGKSQGESENTGETAEEWAERVAKEMGF
jgi:DnaD/phage-associated family protein